MNKRFFFAGILSFLIAGFLVMQCGVYSFSGSSLPSHIKTVGVPLFENETPEFGISETLTDGLIDAVSKDNSLKLDRARTADALLKGKIMRIRDTAGQYNDQEVASDYRVYITIQMEFQDVKKKKNLWEETFTEWGAYENDRDAGIADAVKKLTEDILNRTVAGW